VVIIFVGFWAWQLCAGCCMRCRREQPSGSWDYWRKVLIL